MKYEIKHGTMAAIAKITFDNPGESLTVEASAMVAQSASLKMTTSMKGGLMEAAKRKAFGGESVFQNTFTATQPGEELYVAPGASGDLIVTELDGTRSVMIASNNYVAGDPSITLDAKFAGLKGFFSGTGLALLKASGHGPLFLGSCGAIHAIDIGPEGYVVDNDNLVAFEDTVDYEVKKVSAGWKATLLGGEGAVCHFSGQGRVWISTRTGSSLAVFLSQFRPQG